MLPVAPLAPRHADALRALLVDTFGARGDEATLIARWLDDPTMVALVVEDQDELVGFALASVRDRVDPAPLAEAFGDGVHVLLADGPSAVLNIMAVPRRQRHRGVGTQLGVELEAALRARGVRSCIGISWDHGGPDTSTPLFVRNGFSELGRNRGYYQRFHAETGQRCTTCAPADCQCVAIAFGRVLSP